MATILVLLTLMSNQPLVHKGGRLRGRQSGRKCGDVDDYLSEHGNVNLYRILQLIHIGIVILVKHLFKPSGDLWQQGISRIKILKPTLEYRMKVPVL